MEQIVCQYILAMDHLTHTTQLINLVHLCPGSQTSDAYDRAVHELSELAAALKKPVDLPRNESEQTTMYISLNFGLMDKAESKQRYISMVKQAQEYIAAGDIYQVVLSRPFRYRLAGNPFALYRKLRRENPSPYMFYINFGKRQLVGASPERLVKLEDGRVLTCPIAGTRRRGQVRLRMNNWRQNCWPMQKNEPNTQCL